MDQNSDEWGTSLAISNLQLDFRFAPSRIELCSQLLTSLLMNVGTSVLVKEPDGSRASAVIRWIGNISGKDVVGVEWKDVGRGKNDGMVNGIRYFTCPPLQASFIAPTRILAPITLVDAFQSRYSSGCMWYFFPCDCDCTYCYLGTDQVDVPEDAVLQHVDHRGRVVQKAIEFVGMEKVSKQIEKMQMMRELTAVSLIQSNVAAIGNIDAQHPLQSIETIDLSGNLFTSFCQFDHLLEQCPKLQELMLNDNPFECLHRQTALHPRWQQIALLSLSSSSHSQALNNYRLAIELIIHCEPLALRHLVVCFDASSSSISPPQATNSFPDHISSESLAYRLPQLEVLDLSGLGLADSDVLLFSRLPRLARLSLNSNRLTHMPRPTGPIWFPALSKLSLSDNHIHNVSDLLLWLQCLPSPTESESFDANALTALLSRLHSLSLARNPFQTPLTRCLPKTEEASVSSSSSSSSAAAPVSDAHSIIVHTCTVALLPSLKQFNSSMINYEIRRTALTDLFVIGHRMLSVDFTPEERTQLCVDANSPAIMNLMRLLPKFRSLHLAHNSPLCENAETLSDEDWLRTLQSQSLDDRASRERSERRRTNYISLHFYHGSAKQTRKFKHDELLSKVLAFALQAHRIAPRLHSFYSLVSRQDNTLVTDCFCLRALSFYDIDDNHEFDLFKKY